MLDIIIATYKKNRITVRRAFPKTFIFGRLISGTFTVIFPYFIYTYFLKASLDNSFYLYTKKADYMTYIVLGAAIYSLGVATLMNVGRAMITELREGTLEILLLAPASKNGYFIGCLIEQVGRSSFEFGVVLFIGWILGAELSRVFSLASIAALAIAIFSFFAMALLLSSIMLYSRDTYISQNTLFTFLSLICGISFPVEYLPKWLQSVSQVFPMTPALELFRAVVIQNQKLLDNTSLIFHIILLSTVYIVVGQLWFNNLKTKIVENIFG